MKISLGLVGYVFVSTRQDKPRCCDENMTKHPLGRAQTVIKRLGIPNPVTESCALNLVRPRTVPARGDPRGHTLNSFIGGPLASSSTRAKFAPPELP
jgi:hypothetical protein